MHLMLAEKLMRDPVRNAGVLNFIERYDADSFCTLGVSVLVRGTSDHPWVYLCADSAPEGIALMDRLEAQDRYLVVADPLPLAAVVDRWTPEWVLSCRRLIWPEGLPPGTPEHPVRHLKVRDAEWIYEHSAYQEYTDLAYIRDRIGSGPSGGIEDAEGRLAAWALTHDDGAIGFLNVMEGHREKGYGAAVTRWMIRWVLAEGKLPFVQIEPQNEKSLRLAGRLGFVEAGEIHWVKLKG